MVKDKIKFDIEELPSFNYITSRFLERAESKPYIQEELRDLQKEKENVTVYDVTILESEVLRDYIGYIHKLYYQDIQSKYNELSEHTKERLMSMDERRRWYDIKEKEKDFVKPFEISPEDFQNFMRITKNDVYQYTEEELQKLTDPRNISRIYNELDSLNRYGSLKDVLYTLDGSIQKSKAKNILESSLSSFINYLSDGENIIPNRNIENTKILYNKGVELIKKAKENPTSFDASNKQNLACINELFVSLNALFNHENEIRKHIKVSGTDVEESQENVQRKKDILKEENPLFDVYSPDLFSNVSRDVASYVNSVKDILPGIEIDEDGNKKPIFKGHVIENCLIEDKATGSNIYDKIIYSELSSILGEKKYYTEDQLKDIKKYGKDKIIDIHYKKILTSEPETKPAGIPGRKTRTQLRQEMEQAQKPITKPTKKEIMVDPYIYELYGRPDGNINEQQYISNKINEYYRNNKIFMDDLGKRANGIHFKVNGIFSPIDVYDLEQMMESYGLELGIL